MKKNKFDRPSLLVPYRGYYLIFCGLLIAWAIANLNDVAEFSKFPTHFHGFRVAAGN